MVYYLNIGLVLEQTIRELLNTYIERLQLEKVYSNFHFHVLNEHPFAHMLFENKATSSDTFPCIVVTTQSDSKTPEMMNMSPDVHGIGFTSKDFDELLSMKYRNKTRINELGEVISVMKKGVIQKEEIPGIVMTTDPDSIERLKNCADSRTTEEKEGMVYGIKVNTRRRDKMSLEIWCDNNQLKNELYEQIRMYLTNSLLFNMRKEYQFFDPNIFDGSVNGERSANYNIDFDIVLTGSHISFDIDYGVTSYVFDTEINSLSKNVVTEVYNHVKN